MRRKKIFPYRVKDIHNYFNCFQKVGKSSHSCQNVKRIKIQRATMSEKAYHSDSWGHQLLDCIMKKVEQTFHSDKNDSTFDQKHKLTDKNESISVEDASENVDRSGGDNQRSLSRKPVMIQRSKQIKKKG